MLYTGQEIRELNSKLSRFNVSSDFLEKLYEELRINNAINVILLDRGRLPDKRAISDEEFNKTLDKMVDRYQGVTKDPTVLKILAGAFRGFY